MVCCFILRWTGTDSDFIRCVEEFPICCAHHRHLSRGQDVDWNVALSRQHTIVSCHSFVSFSSKWTRMLLWSQAMVKVQSSIRGRYVHRFRVWTLNRHSRQAQGLNDSCFWGPSAQPHQSTTTNMKSSHCRALLVWIIDEDLMYNPLKPLVSSLTWRTRTTYTCGIWAQ